MQIHTPRGAEGWGIDMLVRCTPNPPQFFILRGTPEWFGSQKFEATRIILICLQISARAHDTHDIDRNAILASQRDTKSIVWVSNY